MLVRYSTKHVNIVRFHQNTNRFPGKQHQIPDCACAFVWVGSQFFTNMAFNHGRRHCWRYRILFPEPVAHTIIYQVFFLLFSPAESKNIRVLQPEYSKTDTGTQIHPPEPAHYKDCEKIRTGWYRYTYACTVIHPGRHFYSYQVLFS